ncbi:MAG: hypothetical protein ACI85O_001176, partial [Saprospiraceae bacterium]
LFYGFQNNFCFEFCREISSLHAYKVKQKLLS